MNDLDLLVRNKRTTQKEIANKLGISQSLVAGVLGNRAGVWVSPENRSKILETARELNYLPNNAARSLRLGKTFTVGCVFFGTAGYAAVIENLADSLADDGYDLLVKVVRSQASCRERLQSLLAGGSCDIALLWGTEGDVVEPGSWFAEAGIPFVVKGRLEAEHPDWLQAEFDHEAMMSQAVHHLKSLGHHKIAYFGFNFGLVYERRLLAGFLDAVGTASSLWVADLSDETRSVRESLEMWFSGPVESWPTAAVSAAGPLTLKTLELWLAGRGIRISDDGGGFAVFGRSSHDYPLIYGQAFGFLDSDVVILARRITQELLLPVLRGEKPAKPILRLLPTMSQLPSHEITSDPPRGWKEK